MYAKGLVSGPPLTIATLTATTSDGDILMRQLLNRGWGWLGEPSPADPAGSLIITHDRLQIVIEDQLVLDDVNPAGPPGWWEAVDHLSGRCLVIIIRNEDLDLAQPDAGSQLQRLLSSHRGMSALLPVSH